MVLVFIILFGIVINRLFNLQIINGESYVVNINSSFDKVMSVASTRGRIFDKNGVLLAYNELAYSVKIADSGVYSSNKEKNPIVNNIIEETLKIIEANGDAFTNDLPIINEDGYYQFTDSDSSILKFKRDCYQVNSVSALDDEQKNASASDMIDYFIKKYGIEADQYTPEHLLEIINLRRYMTNNSYSRYISFTIAHDVSDKTAAAIMESAGKLVGVTVEEEYVRKYVDSIYYAHLVGYTGSISSSQLDDLKLQDSQYEENDVVGKSGIEQAMELELQGQKGSKTVYLDTLGRITAVIDQTDSTTGNDVYLTIDINLQKQVYNAIEDKLVSILLSKIVNSDQVYSYKSDGTTISDISIPIKSVYFALIDNNIVPVSSIAKAETTTAASVYSKFQAKKNEVESRVRTELTSSYTAYSKLGEEMQLYIYNVCELLKKNGVLDSTKIDEEDKTYKAWDSESISLGEYLTYAISQNWIDMLKITDQQYSSLSESYSYLVDYVMNNIVNSNTTFAKKIYKYLVTSATISGNEICALLYDFNVLPMNEASYNGLKSGSISAYSFMIEKITNKEITPGQLALEPCSGSAVITNPQTGDVMAMVSYPSYDLNKLSGTVDAAYYRQLNEDKAKPLINRATMSKTAPGSIYKPVSAVAGLQEGVISPSETISCHGIFDTVTPSFKCWIYPGAHGSENVSTAIRDSCNCFFYEVGYRLSIDSGKYNSTKGTSTLQRYAEMLGLATKTGIEITETTPTPSYTNSIPSAIGQGTNAFTAANLARYVSTIANSGVCRNLTIVDKVTDSDANLLYDNVAEVASTADVSESTWNSVHLGMQMVIQNTLAFKSIPLKVAGKSGTAQENTKKADHATFISYAPYDNPEVAMAVVIRNGYASSNVADLTATLYKIYYGLE